ncbi:MAG: hypothetical protein AAFU49_24930, partial [Pseudomonadota bacterium]
LFPSVALLGAALLVSPAAAVEPAHCYLGEPPADAPLATTLPPPLYDYLQMIDVAMARHACGADTAADQAVLAEERQGAGCSDSSEVAGYESETFAQPSEALAGLYQSQLGMTESAFTAWCGTLSVCVPGETESGYSTACIGALEAAVK